MLVDAFLDSVRRQGDTPAVNDGMKALSFSRLGLLARVFRDVIQKETECPRIGIILPASTAFPAALFGTLWAGRIVVPLNFLLAPEELLPVVQDAGLDLVLTVRHFAELTAKLPVRALFLEDLGLKRRLLLAMLRSVPPAPAAKPDDTAVILYTSGTTARPKGVELTQNNLHSNATDCIATLNIQPPQRFLNVLPPFHVFGLTAGVLVPTFMGATTFALPRFNPLGAIHAVRDHGITVMMAIPSMYAAMLRTKSATAESFTGVTLAISGGEPLSDSVRESFHARFGVHLRQGYGLTETSPVVAVSTLAATRDGAVGKPIRNATVRIVDADGKTLPDGQDGEILVRGPGVMKGYYHQPEETGRVIDAEGWFHTGDVGRLDADGFLAITGRAKEMLIVGGENVFPREIEAVLETHEAVLQAAVIGVPDDLRGETPVAFVMPRKGAEVTESELRNFAKLSLAGFKVPRRVIIREDLPAGPTGKILKRKLRELL